MATIQAKDIAAIFDTLRDQRDEARAQAISAGAEIMRLIVENGELRDALQDWQVAAGTRKAEIDALSKRVAELTICDCGERLSTGKCSICDRDE